MRLDLAEDLLLDRRVLEDGLDDEVGARRGGRIVGGGDPREQRVPLLLRDLPAGDALGHQGLGVPPAPVGRLLRDVLEDDLDAALGALVGDPRAHHARPEHHDLPRGVRLRVGRAAARAVDGLQIEEERLDMFVETEPTAREVNQRPSIASAVSTSTCAPSKATAMIALGAG